MLHRLASLSAPVLAAFPFLLTACVSAGLPITEPLATVANPSEPTAPASDLHFASVFTDHIVLQRDTPITIWGTAPAGTPVTIRFADAVLSATSNSDGDWSAEFPALPSGGPYDIAIASDTGDTNTVTDVLIGDVYLCSGQSNMEMKVSRARNAPSEINRKHSSTIRHFHPRYKISPAPLRNLAEPVEWTVASKDTAADFSAVCYFFAKARQAIDPAPIGLLHSSWGGSQIEAWISQPDLRTVAEFSDSLDILNLHARDEAAGITALGQQWQNWYSEGTGGLMPWLNDPETDQGWSDVPRLTSWRNFGDEGLKKHDGLVWYRNNFTLTEAQAAREAEIVLGKLSHGDIVWINGHFLGRSAGWGVRRYDVPASLLNPGTNHVLINVRSMWGDGGMMGPAEAIGITPQGGNKIAMSEGWQYRKEASGLRMTPLIPWATMAGYTGMYNGMIAPLSGLKFKAGVWYQGESNTRRAWQYGELFRVMTQNWRAMFGADMPVMIVQLPEFGSAVTKPIWSDWGNFREAQRQAALADPNVALVVTMGLGDSSDIHPTNKQDVGKRIARAYRGLIGETDASVSGYSPLRAYTNDAVIHVELPVLDKGYVTRSAARPIALELCGDTPVACAFADATLEGNSLVLSSDTSSSPTHVRYCWGNSPICNLYSAEGQPVGPFEIAIE